MTEENGNDGNAGTLDAVKRLEQSLDGHQEAAELAAARLAAAGKEAEAILAAARTAGTEEGSRRAAAYAADAAAEAEATRTRGLADAQELLGRVQADRDDLVDELSAIVTAEEG